MINSENYLVIDGGTVKTEEEGIVRGLGIVFGSENEPDQSQQKDFFTAKSSIRKKKSFDVPLYLEHGLGLIRDEIGEATLTKSELGWEAVARIDMDDEAGKRVYEQVKNKPFGFSTGALQHLVEREAKSNGTNFLKKWVVGELSLTERPAERKAVVQAVKSLDGEVVYEEAFPADVETEVKTEVVIELFDENREKIWETVDSLELPSEDITKDAKTIDLKFAHGSVTYSLMTGDEDDDEGVDMHVVHYGTPSGIINAIQSVLNKASEAVKMAEAPTEEDFDSRVASIVNTVLKSNTENPRIVELETEIKNKDSELAELQAKVAQQDEALTIANEKIGHLTILAGAQETITKLTGI